MAEVHPAQHAGVHVGSAGSVVSYKELWRRDLQTGRERQLTALGRGFTIRDFDISPDGRERLFDRARDESDIVLIERPK
jgi:hypothetical protein